MPGAKSLSYNLLKFLMTFFSHLHKIYLIDHAKNSDDLFKNSFTQKDYCDGLSDAPPGWMPGAWAPSAPPSARHWYQERQYSSLSHQHTPNASASVCDV